LPLIGALLVGAGILFFVDRWRKRPDHSKPSGEEELTHYRTLYEQGELSREEYDRLKALLGGRLRKELNLPPLADAPIDKPAEDKPPEPPATDIQAG
jgi:hypothetical protein